MKTLPRRILQSVALTLALGVVAPAAADAQATTDVTYTGNYGWVYDGYYVGPYRGVVSYLGGETVDLYCVDSAHWVTGSNNPWQAWVTPLSSGTSLSNTYLGARSDITNAYDRYWMAAYLTTQFWTPGVDAGAEFGAIHGAIWNLTTGAMPSGFSAPYSSSNQYANTDYWINQAAANYQTYRGANGGSWAILTDVAGSSQEFLVRTPSVVPEPSTWLLFATGLAGLFGFGTLRRRRRDAS